MEAGLDWDLLPEEFPYQDDGCELWPHCLDCPFPTCIKEEPWGIERFTKLRRAERMMELKRQGKSSSEIARLLDCSPRTVQRWLRIANDKENFGPPSPGGRELEGGGQKHPHVPCQIKGGDGRASL